MIPGPFLRPLLAALAVVLFAAGGCAASSRAAPALPAPPMMMMGEFADDYGARYVIGADEWRHGSRNRYYVLKWNAAGQYLIARNDLENAGEGGLFTRIDWLVLPGMPPWEWGYCYSAYKAPSAAAAESVSVARREMPRTGCDGHPFTRMRRTSLAAP